MVRASASLCVRHGSRTSGDHMAHYQFSTDRKGAHPATHIKGYTGIVHADGFTGFNGLFGPGLASEQACMVHVRRKFVDAFEREGSAIARKPSSGLPSSTPSKRMPDTRRRKSVSP